MVKAHSKITALGAESPDVAKIDTAAEAEGKGSFCSTLPPLQSY